MSGFRTSERGGLEWLGVGVGTAVIYVWGLEIAGW